jgi:hypothetical protein
LTVKPASSGQSADSWAALASNDQPFGFREVEIGNQLFRAKAQR